MSYITYTPNEIVYVQGIGYATLLNCGLRTQIAQNVEPVPAKKESIYFDPDLFNTDLDSLHPKKSQLEEERAQKKAVDAPSLDSKDAEAPMTQVQERREGEVVNMVQARMEGGALVYTPQRNLSKSITLVVQSFLVSKREQIIIEVQISKTIDTVKKQIFTQLGQQICQFYNIRLFSCTPILNQLSVASKTVSQYLIKDNSKLVLTATHGFTFEPLTPHRNSKYKVTLNNNTIVSSKIVQQPKKAEEKGLVPPKAQGTKPEKTEEKGQKKVERTEEVSKKQNKKAQQPKKPNIQPLQEQKKQTNRITAKCSASFSSGKHYWQIKIEKLPTDPQDLVIGICIQSVPSQQSTLWNFESAWAHMPISGKKVLVEKGQQDAYEEEVQPYGYAIKQNEIIGVLLWFRGKKAVLTFYKNNISCGPAYILDTVSEEGEKRQFTPFVNIGSECQITLDSKALPPLDSYRLA